MKNIKLALMIIATSAVMTACQKEVVTPDGTSSGPEGITGYAQQDDKDVSVVDNNRLLKRDPDRNNGKGGGKKDAPEDTTSTEEDPFVVSYRVYDPDDPGSLYRFSISASGGLILLETDPTITSWGTDYWGYWEDPFVFANNIVDYTIGLSRTIYEFDFLSESLVDVSVTWIRSSYLGSTIDTTYEHPGIYKIE